MFWTKQRTSSPSNGSACAEGAPRPAHQSNENTIRQRGNPPTVAPPGEHDTSAWRMDSGSEILGGIVAESFPGNVVMVQCIFVFPSMPKCFFPSRSRSKFRWYSTSLNKMATHKPNYYIISFVHSVASDYTHALSVVWHGGQWNDEPWGAFDWPWSYDQW